MYFPLKSNVQHKKFGIVHCFINNKNSVSNVTCMQTNEILTEIVRKLVLSKYHMDSKLLGTPFFQSRNILTGMNIFFLNAAWILILTYKYWVLHWRLPNKTMKVVTLNDKLVFYLKRKSDQKKNGKNNECWIYTLQEIWYKKGIKI